MAERDDPLTPSKAPLSADRDERSARGGRRGRRGRGGGTAGPGLGTKLVLFALILALTGGGWFVAEQHRVLTETREQLAETGGRVGQLEARLEMTGETFAETGTELQDQIEFWESEVRKLWTVSNERNREWIEANQARLEDHAGRLGAVQDDLANLTGRMERVDDAFAQQQEQLAALLEGQAELAEQTQMARQSVSQLESGLVERVANSEEAIEAIDAYRVQINRRVADLSSRLDALAAAEANASE